LTFDGCLCFNGTQARNNFIGWQYCFLINLDFMETLNKVQENDSMVKKEGSREDDGKGEIGISIRLIKKIHPKEPKTSFGSFNFEEDHFF
jgi:hypothetical protein